MFKRTGTHCSVFITVGKSCCGTALSGSRNREETETRTTGSSAGGRDSGKEGRGDCKKPSS